VGYYTQYSLKQLRNPIPKEALAALIAEDECASQAVDFLGGTRNSEKWYDHEESLCAWSVRYPKTIFCLHAEGEDTDGIWDKYFLGGKVVHIESFEGLPTIDLDSVR